MTRLKQRGPKGFRQVTGTACGTKVRLAIGFSPDLMKKLNKFAAKQKMPLSSLVSQIVAEKFA